MPLRAVDDDYYGKTICQIRKTAQRAITVPFDLFVFLYPLPDLVLSLPCHFLLFGRFAVVEMELIIFGVIFLNEAM